jgi:acetyl esterase
MTKDVTYPAAPACRRPGSTRRPARGANAPVVLYIHGGGWVIADIDVYDSSPRALAKATGAIVVSIEYRHAPEAKFPAAHDDVNAAYKWVLANAKWGGDPTKVAVVGESAGGNMAVNVAIAARDTKLQAPKAVVAVYPVADSNMATGSKVAKVATKPLNTPMLAWFFTNTLAKPGDAFDPRLNLVGADLKGLPPTTIILAEIDPLHDDGVNLADKLREAAGVQTDGLKEYAGVTHEFFGMGSVVANGQGRRGLRRGQAEGRLRRCRARSTSKLEAGDQELADGRVVVGDQYALGAWAFMRRSPTRPRGAPSASRASARRGLGTMSSKSSSDSSATPAVKARIGV